MATEKDDRYSFALGEQEHLDQLGAQDEYYKKIAVGEGRAKINKEIDATIQSLASIKRNKEKWQKLLTARHAWRKARMEAGVKKTNEKIDDAKQRETDYFSMQGATNIEKFLNSFQTLSVAINLANEPPTTLRSGYQSFKP